WRLMRSLRALLVLLAAACNSGESQTGQKCGANGVCPAGFTCDPVDNICKVSGGGAVDAALPDGPPPCPAVDKLVGASGPTMHAGGELTAPETWSAEGSPHVVTGQVRVSTTLTIAPCANVVLNNNGYITVGQNAADHLVAEGTAAQPIRFAA